MIIRLRLTNFPMSFKLPSLKSREVLSVLFREGFMERRICGSHLTLVKGERRVTVPLGKGHLPPGTLNSIIRQAGLTRQKFLELLRK